jgi:hypothetical protein
VVEVNGRVQLKEKGKRHKKEKEEFLSELF